MNIDKTHKFSTKFSTKSSKILCLKSIKMIMHNEQMGYQEFMIGFVFENQKIPFSHRKKRNSYDYFMRFIKK